MTRRKRHDLAPTLFPFLAVLVCTLGTLILLLALVSQNTAAAAQQKARDEMRQASVSTEPNAEPLSIQEATALIDEATVRIESLHAARRSQASDLEARRDQLTHLEDHIGRLSDELARLSREVEMTMTDRSVQAVSAEKLADLRAQISRCQEEIDQLHREGETQTPRVVIVPHKGPNGTTRRPIYVECTADGLTIWPEGVEIPAQYLSERQRRGANPLDAALRVARLHIMQVYGDADPPYPLLVVRPHGTDAYFQATAAMDDWDDQYGYEMLDSGIELALPTPDLNLKQRMEEAIGRAIARQTDRATPKAVPLSASQLARDGRARGFGSRPQVGYGVGSSGSGVAGRANPHGDLASQTARLNDLYRQATEELRQRDESGDQAAAAHGQAQQGVSEGGPRPRTGLAGDDATPAEGLTETGADAGEPLSDSAAIARRAPSAGGGNGDARATAAPGAVSPAGENPAPAEQSPASAPDIEVNRATKKMVQRGGQDWALPPSVTRARGISIVRSIRVQCHPDRLVLLPSRTDGYATIAFGQDADRAVLEFATEVRDRIGRWGVALDNGRWQPKLEVEVIGESRHRLEQLRHLMDGSGIEITERQTP